MLSRRLSWQIRALISSDGDTQDVVRLCAAGILKRRRVEELRRVQEKHAILYSTVLQIAELRKRRELKPSTAREVMMNLRNRAPLHDVPFGDMDSSSVAEDVVGKMAQRPLRRASNASSMRIKVRQTTVAILPASSPASIGSRLRPLWSEALSDDFVLDTGVPYQRTFQPRILLVETWPENRFDPSKPARVAAFSSWLMAIPTTAEDIEALIDRSLQITSERIYA